MMSTRILFSLESLFGAKEAKLYQRYICPQCNEILKDAVQTVNCGHFLCADCAGFEIFRYKEQARCPQIDCNQILCGDDGTEYFPDRRFRREVDEINKLQVECPLRECVWTGLFEEFTAHRQSQHPSAVWQSMPKRRAPRAVVTIQQEQSLDQTPQPAGKKLDTLGKLKHIERLKADSLKTSQNKAGAEASSNQSLKRASEPKMFQGQSDTLDAATAQMRFETTPETEVACKEEVVKNKTDQLVHGSSKKPSHRRNPSDVISKPTILSPVQPSATNAESHKPRDTIDGSASSSSPRRHLNRRRKSPPTTSLRPPSPRSLIIPTHQPSARHILSPTSQFQLPTISQASIMEQDSTPLQSPPSHVPRPQILSTRRTPVPRAFYQRTKANSMPQDSSKCCQCKRKDKQLIVLQNTVEELLKENASPTCTCNEKDSFRRNRIMSF